MAITLFEKQSSPDLGDKHTDPDIKLRSASSILKVVETYEEATTYSKQLASRKIGGVCIKGVVVNKTHEPLRDNSELLRFANNLTFATAGICSFDYELRMRQSPRMFAEDNYKPTLFSADKSMHFDAIYEEQEESDGSIDFNMSFPLIRSIFYHGVSHHLTTGGFTNFVMERLSRNAITQLTRGQRRREEGILDTNPHSFPLTGEITPIEAGDYIAFHAYGEYKAPLFIHGTTGSSDNRISVSYQAPITQRLNNR